MHRDPPPKRTFYLSIFLMKTENISIFPFPISPPIRSHPIPFPSLPHTIPKPHDILKMGAAASMHASRAAPWEAGITHAQRVTRLYRNSLRTSRDWIIDYELWVKDAENIQALFRVNKNKSVTEGRFLAEKGLAELFKRRHPEPYIPIYAPGSSSYQRNVPPPPEVSCAFSCISCISSYFNFFPFLTSLHFYRLPPSCHSLLKGPCRPRTNVFSSRSIRIQ